MSKKVGESHKTASACPYCAQAPVPHWAQFIIGTVDGVLSVLKRFCNLSLFDRTSNFYRRLTHPLAQGLEHAVMRILALGQLARIQRYLPDNMTGRLRMVWQEAVRRNIRIEYVSLLGTVGEECRALLPIAPAKDSRKRWVYFQGIPVPPWLKTGGWVDDKAEMKHRFAQVGLMVPHGRTVLTKRAALRAARLLGWPVIVKPREGSRARHTFLNISNETDLVAAFALARQLGAFVLVEQCVPGDTYRATCVGGKLIAVMHFQKPRVKATGTHTCEELCERYNASLSYTGVSPVSYTPWFRAALLRQGFTPESIPDAGVLVTLAEHSERSNGGVNEDVTERIPELTRSIIERAARLAGSAVIGFDLVSPDLTNPSAPFWFIEGNTLPFIDIHHEPTRGKPRAVASTVWDLWSLEKDAVSQYF